MKGKNITLNNRKKLRIDICSIEEFKKASEREGYILREKEERKLKEEIQGIFDIDEKVTKKLYELLNEGEYTFRVDNIKGFIDYIEKIILFEEKHNELCNEIKKIEKLQIDREEYERELSIQDNVDEIIDIIERLKDKISSRMDKEDLNKIDKIEKELSEHYVYAKDIELLKKMIINKNDKIYESYNVEERIKTLIINIPSEINKDYIKPLKGSVEYYHHLNSNIPRIERLIKNLYKYIKCYEKKEKISKIDQSEALQDTINIAIATFDNKEFKAISGKNNIEGYCSAPDIENAVFEACKVNKLGKLGIGYRRVNDSEKKIFEEIHKQIKNKVLKDKGELILYSKWQPCQSCYYVISQFCALYPNVKVKVKYDKKYGE